MRVYSRTFLQHQGVMVSTVVAVLVITLLAPGLALLVAVVIRFLLRGAHKPPGSDAADEEPDAGT